MKKENFFTFLLLSAILSFIGKLHAQQNPCNLKGLPNQYLNYNKETSFKSKDTNYLKKEFENIYNLILEQRSIKPLNFKCYKLLSEIYPSLLEKRANVAKEEIDFSAALSYYGKALNFTVENFVFYVKSFPNKKEEEYNFLKAQKAMYYNSAGVLYGMLGSFEDAKKDLDTSIKLLGEIRASETVDYARYLGNRAFIFQETGDFKLAINDLHKVIKIKSKNSLDTSTNIEISMASLGNTYRLNAKFDSAKLWLDSALKLARKKINNENLLYCYNEIGTLYRDITNYKEAKKSYNLALSLAKGSSRDSATCLRNLGVLEYTMGEYARSKDYYYKALEIEKRLSKRLSRNHPNLAIVLNECGRLFQRYSEYDSAVFYYENSLKIREQTLGKENHMYAKSLMNIGDIYSIKKDFINAEKNYKEAGPILEKKLGRDHPEYASYLGRYGQIYMNKAEFKNAVAKHKRALEIRKLKYNDLHPTITISCNSLGETYLLWGKLDSAEYFLKKAEENNNKIQPPNPAHKASTLLLYGDYYRISGNYGESKKYMDSALRLIRIKLGDTTDKYADGLAKKALLSLELGQYDQAITQAKNSMEVYKKNFKTIEHPKYANNLLTLSTIYKEKGDFKLAGQKIDSALRILEGTYKNKQHSDLARAKNIEGNYNLAIGQYKKAEECYNEGIKILTNIYKKDTLQSIELGSIYNDYGHYLLLTSQYKEAKKNLTKAYKIENNIYSPENPSLSKTLSNLGKIHHSEYQLDSAEIKYMRAFELVLNRNSNNSVLLAKRKSEIGSLYKDKGDYNCAMDYLKESLKSQKGNLGEESPEYIQSLLNLSDLHKVTGQYKLARKYLDTCLKNLKNKNSFDYIKVRTSKIEIHRLMGNYQEAEADLKELQRELKKDSTKHPEFEVELYISNARIQNDKGDYVSALQNYKRAQEILNKLYGYDDVLKYHPKYARLYQLMGNYFRERGQYDSAEQNYEWADKIYNYKKMTSGPEYAQMLYETGLLYTEMEEYDKAQNKLKEAMVLRKSTLKETHIDYAVSLNEYGRLWQKKGKLDSAFYYYTKAKKIREKINESGEKSLLVGKSLRNIGRYYSEKNEMDSALNYYKAADEIIIPPAKDKDNSRDQINLTIEFASLYRRMGFYTAAEKKLSLLYMNNEKRIQNINDRRDYYLEFAALKEASGDYNAALNYYKKAESLLKSDTFSSGYKRTLTCLGTIYSKMSVQNKKYNDSADYYLNKAIQKSAERQSKTKIPVAQAQSMIKYGEHLMRLKEYKKADSIFTLCLSVIGKDSSNIKSDFCTALRDLGICNKFLNNYSISHGYLIRYFKNYPPQKGSMTDEYLDTRCEYAFSLLRRNQKDSATKIMQSYFQQNKTKIKAEIESIQKTGSYLLEDLEKKIESKLESYNRISQFAVICNSKAAIELNYNACLFFKGLYFRSESNYSGISEKITNRQNFLNSQKKEANNKDSIDGIIAKLTQMKEDYDSMNNSDVQKLRQKLMEKDVAIEFIRYSKPVKGLEKYFYKALVLKNDPDNKTAEIEQIDSLCEEGFLSKEVEKMQHLLFTKNPDNTETLNNLHEIYKRVWSPLENYLAKNDIKRVYYSTTGILLGIPFSAMVVQLSYTNPRYLSDTMDLVNVTSTRNIMIHHDVPIEKKFLNIYGGIDYDFEFKRPEIKSQKKTTVQKDEAVMWKKLNCTNDEVKAIVQIFEEKSENAMDCSNMPVTEDSLFKRYHPNVHLGGILHMATHGANFTQSDTGLHLRYPNLKKQDPLKKSMIVLSGGNHAWQMPGTTTKKAELEDGKNGILDAREIAQNMDLLDVELVVLSACETAAGQLHNTEGILGLQRGLQMAGAQKMLLTHYKIEDCGGTLEFMKAFYNNLINVKDNENMIQKAFNAARRSQQDRHRLDPYTWAAFELIY